MRQPFHLPLFVLGFMTVGLASIDAGPFCGRRCRVPCYYDVQVVPACGSSVYTQPAAEMKDAADGVSRDKGSEHGVDPANDAKVAPRSVDGQQTKPTVPRNYWDAPKKGTENAAPVLPPKPSGTAPSGGQFNPAVPPQTPGLNDKPDNAIQPPPTLPSTTAPSDDAELPSPQPRIESGSGRTLPMRTWTDDTGEHQVNARLVLILENKVRLFKANGRFSTVPMSRLSDLDQAYVTRIATKYGRGEQRQFVSR